MFNITANHIYIFKTAWAKPGRLSFPNPEILGLQKVLGLQSLLMSY